MLDEAYIDFAHDNASLAQLASEYPNLVVVHTLSKAFGLAAIRVGIVYAASPIISLLENLSAPWNIPSPSLAIASHAVSEEGIMIMGQNRARIISQRYRCLEELPKINGVGRVRSGHSSNFLLFETLDRQLQPDNKVAMATHEGLAGTVGVLVRYRGDEFGCFGCLRVTIGTEIETTKFLDSLRGMLLDVRNRGNSLS